MRKWLALPVVLIILLFLGVGSVFAFRFLVSAPSEDPTPVALTIDEGEPVVAISEKLAEEGLIRNAWVYRIFVRLSGFETKLQAGQFRLAKNLSMKDLTYRITRGTTDQTITTLEGWRIEEVAEHLDKNQVVTKDEFLEVAGAAEFDYSFLPKYENGLDKPYRRLEGYLFPDTYQIAAQSSAETIINIMLQNFDSRVTDVMRADVSKAELTLSEATNLASIVEREVRNDTDRPIVAGILLKRYKTSGWRIEADATIQYAVGKSDKWWTPLQDSARSISPDSPYNTYTHDNLPPTPISNPGLASIRAVIYSESSEFWFYISDNDGVMHYARTIEEQNENISKYLR